MALLDLGLVTKCFITLLSERIPTFPDWPGGTLLVSGGPPDLVKGGQALSFYLYHAREDAHTKSQDWQGSDPNPQKFKPMGLSLYYVLTPRSDTTDPHQRALTDQLLMGLALKTLRDVSRIDDTTAVDTLGGPVFVMPTTMRGRGNYLRSTLMPTPPSEAAHYWQAGTGPLRLAAYYEVAQHEAAQHGTESSARVLGRLPLTPVRRGRFGDQLGGRWEWVAPNRFRWRAEHGFLATLVRADSGEFEVPPLDR